jgi:hypothetical protein
MPASVQEVGPQSQKEPAIQHQQEDVSRIENEQQEAVAEGNHLAQQFQILSIDGRPENREIQELRAELKAEQERADRAEAEKERAEAERERAEAELKAEKERAEAEKERAEAELKAEKERAEAEKERAEAELKAEKERAEAEIERAEAEKERAEAELKAEKERTAEIVFLGGPDCPTYVQYL